MNENILNIALIDKAINKFETIKDHLSNLTKYKQLFVQFLGDIINKYDRNMSNNDKFLKQHEMKELIGANLSTDSKIVEIVEKMLNNRFVNNSYTSNLSLLNTKLFWMCLSSVANDKENTVLLKYGFQKEDYVTRLLVNGGNSYKLYFNFNYDIPLPTQLADYQ